MKGRLGLRERADFQHQPSRELGHSVAMAVPAKSEVSRSPFAPTSSCSCSESRQRRA